jgi:hypothetical protein
MKRVGIVHRGETRVFVVDSTHIDDDEFKKLIRLEFGLAANDELALGRRALGRRHCRCASQTGYFG